MRYRSISQKDLRSKDFCEEGAAGGKSGKFGLPDFSRTLPCRDELPQALCASSLGEGALLLPPSLRVRRVRRTKQFHMRYRSISQKDLRRRKTVRVRRCARGRFIKWDQSAVRYRAVQCGINQPSAAEAGRYAAIVRVSGSLQGLKKYASSCHAKRVMEGTS